jgi:hypothetical protein
MLTTTITTKSASPTEAYEMADGIRKEWTHRRDAGKLAFEKKLSSAGIVGIFILRSRLGRSRAN